MNNDNGGPAFPGDKPLPTPNGYQTPTGMTLREYFAARCPEEWYELQGIVTVGDVKDALIIRGIVPQSRKDVRGTDSYTKSERMRLWICIRYEYADAMIAQRNRGADT